jgi:hypothetical protein
MPAKLTGLPPDLAAARTRINKWRSSGRTRRPIPDDVWEMAVELVPAHGVYRVSRALRLRYDKLKTQAKTRRSARRPRSRTKPAFVQVAAPTPAMPGQHIECLVELTDKNGHHMAIRSSAAVDVARLVATFCAGEWGAT